MLVTATTAEITTTVTNGQKVVDALPRGEHCMNLGQDIVTKATATKKKADKHLVTCKRALEAARNHEVYFGPRIFSELIQGKCGSFYSMDSYQNAKSRHATALAAQDRAIGQATEAAEGLKGAIAGAKEAVHACLCTTRADHEKAMKEGNKDKETNAKAWVQAHQLACVLEDKTSCKIPACPTVTRPPVTAAVKEATCAVAATPAGPDLKQAIINEAKHNLKVQQEDKAKAAAAKKAPAKKALKQEKKVAQKPRKEVKAPAKKALKQEKKVAQKAREEVKKGTSTISNKKAEEVTPSGSGETVGQFVKQITSNWKASPSAVAKKSSAPQSAATNLMLTLVLVISTALYCN